MPYFLFLVNIMKKWLKELLPYIVIILVVLLIKQFVVTPIVVNGPSMEPTLKENDVMLLDKISYRFSEIERFDIVVIHHHDSYIIKRVIGLPGERVMYQNNQLYINGEIVEENFEHRETENYSIEQLNSEFVPENSYFVLGDNRVNSSDSRNEKIGFVSKDQIIGHAKYTLFPFDRFGSKK